LGCRPLLHSCVDYSSCFRKGSRCPRRHLQRTIAVQTKISFLQSSFSYVLWLDGAKLRYHFLLCKKRRVRCMNSPLSCTSLVLIMFLNNWWLLHRFTVGGNVSHVATAQKRHTWQASLFSRICRSTCGRLPEQEFGWIEWKHLSLGYVACQSKNAPFFSRISNAFTRSGRISNSPERRGVNRVQGGLKWPPCLQHPKTQLRHIRSRLCQKHSKKPCR